MSQKLEELLLRWEDQRQTGKPASVEVLCRDCPELREQLQVRIRALEKMNQVLDLKSVGTMPTNGRPRTRYDDLRPNQEPVPGYRLEKLLGKGGFGEVWKAIGPGGFAVALKFVSLNGNLGAGELRSLEVIKTLHHPNLLATFGSWQTGGFLVIAMELADRTLLDRLHEAVAQGLQGIPGDELIRYMHEAAKGIDYLNQPDERMGDSTKAAIQHRDIKPQNILLMGGGIKIGDFGLLRILKTTVTEQNGSLTLAYAAPEFLSGHAARSSDQYSLAVTYCHLRGGHLPFVGHAGQVMEGHLKHPPDLSMLPEAEREPVARALQKDPKQRWNSCGEFVAALSKLQEGKTPSQTPSVRRQPWNKRLMIGISVIACAVLFIAFFVTRGPSPFSPGNAQPSQQYLELDLGRGVKMKLVRVEPGKFIMGSSKNEQDYNCQLRNDDWAVQEKQHEVEITRPFYMGVYEVTQLEYEQVMGKNPSHFSSSGRGKKEVASLDTSRFPVESVSWEDAMRFCRTLSAKVDKVVDLPTEAEWEFACRAGAQGPFHYGTSLSSKQANFDGNFPYGGADKGLNLERTTQVGSYQPNAFGLHDMHGNVYEFCKDWYERDYYGASPHRDPQGPATGKLRVVRGGSVGQHAKECRSAFRCDCPPVDSRSPSIGFRTVVRLPLELDLGNGVKMKMERIDPNKFVMGSPPGESGRNQNEYQHEVHISKPFYMSIHHVTRGQFRAFVEATAYKTEAEKDGKGGGGYDAKMKEAYGYRSDFTWRSVNFDQTDQHPVVNVTWNDAIAFCQWLSGKSGLEVDLPTEAQWEYACRAGSKTRFSFGNDEMTFKEFGNIADRSLKRKCDYAGTGFKERTDWFKKVSWDDGYPFTSPVGQFMPNEWGLYDMHGNAWQWCKDWYVEDLIKDSGAVDPRGPHQGTSRVARGGSFLLNPELCRSACRACYPPTFRNLDFGFRVIFQK